MAKESDVSDTLKQLHNLKAGNLLVIIVIRHLDEMLVFVEHKEVLKQRQVKVTGGSQQPTSPALY